MATPAPVSGAPAVSVIVPARNEEDCIGACLESLVSQTGVSFEILLVDDASTDRTRAIAESFAQVRIVDSGPPPAGWSGKNNAVTAGSRAAQGEWLLFTDADTVHLPGSLARALAEARARKADLLSYSPEQEVRTLAEKAVMPVIFAELATTFRPADVSNPNSPAAAANGQYILIERDAYNAVGGHAAVAGSLLEDVALARTVKQSGRNIFFRYGGDIVRTRMYRSFPQLVEGWTKNLALLFPRSGDLAFWRATEFVVLFASLFLSIACFAQTKPSIDSLRIIAVTVALWFLFFRRIRRAHFSWDATLLAPVGLPLFSYLLLRSKIKHMDGRVSWKGRIYGASEAQPSSNDPSARSAVKQDLRSVP